MVSDTVSREIYAEVLPDFPDGQKALKRCKPAERLQLDLISDDQAGRKGISVLRSTGERIGSLTCLQNMMNTAACLNRWSPAVPRNLMLS